MRDVSGSATRSRLPVGAFDDAHLVTRSSCRSVCSCSSTRGTRRPHGHALRCTSELLRRERSIGSTREFQLGERNRRLSTRQPMDGSDGSTRVARLVLRLRGHFGDATPVTLSSPFIQFQHSQGWALAVRSTCSVTKCTYCYSLSRRIN